MPADPIALALRRDAEALLEKAPPANAAAAWHAVRAARARKLETALRRAGWGLRIVVATLAAVLAALEPAALAGAVLPLLLTVWLTSAMCARVMGAPNLPSRARQHDRTAR